MDELFDFVTARTHQAARDAARRGDREAERFHRGTLAIIDATRRDITNDPRHAPEIKRFLCRSSVAYADHDDFCSNWFLEIL